MGDPHPQWESRFSPEFNGGRFGELFWFWLIRNLQSVMMPTIATNHPILMKSDVVWLFTRHARNPASPHVLT